MYAMNPTTCFTDAENLKEFIWFDTFSNLDYWGFWWGWPNQNNCSESFLVMYALCIGRWVLTALAFVYCVFVLINFKAIEDAINCIKLASEVLFQNFILVVQPL